MERFFIPFAFGALLSGCAVSTGGAVSPGQPAAVQGSNDVQGNPISVPGAGMGVGAGRAGGGISATSPGGATGRGIR